MRRLRHFAWAIALAALAVSEAGAQSTPPANADCQVCHAEPSMTRATGQPVVVTPQVFDQSVHAPLACVDCHSDLAATTEFPHPEKLSAVACATCHDEPAQRLASSVHARIPEARGGAASCLDCHGPPHAMRGGTDPESPTNKLQIAMTCGRCHSGMNAPSTRQGPAVAALFADSIHGQALNRSGLVVAPTCSDCHRSHDVLTRSAPASPVHRLNVTATCGTCHAGIQREFGDSVHAAALKEGLPTAPHCASCHTAHAITRTQSDDWQLSAVEQCGTCHREALASYRDTFHGQVTALGFTPVAKCMDCHQAHRVFRASDARSTVSQANLLTTCRTCHPSATASFIQYQPHANPHDRERLPVLYHSARFMHVLLIAVFAFFGIHSALWFARERTGDEARKERRD